MEYSLWMLQIRKGKHASIPLAWLTNHHPSRQCFIRYSTTQWTRKIGNSFQINTGSGQCLCLVYFVMNFNHGYKCKCKVHIKDTRYDSDENSGICLFPIWPVPNFSLQLCWTNDSSMSVASSEVPTMQQEIFMWKQ